MQCGDHQLWAVLYADQPKQSTSWNTMTLGPASLNDAYHQWFILHSVQAAERSLHSLLGSLYNSFGEMQSEKFIIIRQQLLSMVARNVNVNYASCRYLFADSKLCRRILCTIGLCCKWPIVALINFFEAHMYIGIYVYMCHTLTLTQCHQNNLPKVHNRNPTLRSAFLLFYWYWHLDTDNYCKSLQIQPNKSCSHWVQL